MSYSLTFEKDHGRGPDRHCHVPVAGDASHSEADEKIVPADKLLMVVAFKNPQLYTDTESTSLSMLASS